MTPIKSSIKYLEYFCQHDLDGLSSLLSEHFVFRAPMIECQSKEIYLDSLRSHRQENIEIEILHKFQDDKKVCLIYDLELNGVSTCMSQIFLYEQDLIVETMLIFDRISLDKTS